MAKISTIAVVPTSSSVDVTSFVENLADALQFYGFELASAAVDISLTDKIRSSLHVSRELLFTKVSEDGHVEGPSDLDLDESPFSLSVPGNNLWTNLIARNAAIDDNPCFE